MTLDQWLGQLGAWQFSTRMKTGDAPDCLTTNIIARLMQSTGERKIASYYGRETLKITDDEAIAIDQMLCDAYASSDDAKEWIDYLVWNRVSFYKYNLIASVMGSNDTKISGNIKAGKAFIHGKYGFRLN